MSHVISPPTLLVGPDLRLDVASEVGELHIGARGRLVSHGTVPLSGGITLTSFPSATRARHARARRRDQAGSN